jgi:hypothetical protein
MTPIADVAAKAGSQRPLLFEATRNVIAVEGESGNGAVFISSVFPHLNDN